MREFNRWIFTKCTFLNPINRLACMRKPQTFYTLTVRVIARDKSSTWRLTTAIFHGTSLWGEQSSAVCSRRSANGESVSDKLYLGQKNHNRRAVWPLREGREIRGVDGAFASLSWRRECVRGGVVPSANELAWFYKGFRQSARPEAFPKRESSRSVSEPMIENSCVA